MLLAVDHGMGSHEWDIIARSGMNGIEATLKVQVPVNTNQTLTTRDLLGGSQCLYSGIIAYNASMMATKLTIVAQYYRIIAVQNTRHICLAVLFIVGSWCFSQLMVAILNCIPVATLWDNSIEGHCVDMKTAWYVNAGGNIVTDIMVFILPLPVFYQLQLPKRQKLFLLGVFCLGFLYVHHPLMVHR